MYMTMDLSPIIISLKTATLSIIITFFLGVAAAQLVFRLKSKTMKTNIRWVIYPAARASANSGRIFFTLYFRDEKADR